MERNIKTKKMILNSILIALGALLHQITPALGLPMQPDFALAMLFIIMVINSDYKSTILSAIIIGVLTALTTKFPGGQLPNMIDKIVTANLMYLLILPFKNKLNDIFKIILLLSLGTAVSGIIFLFSASILVGLPAGFFTLVKVVVLPAALMNVFLGTILYKAVSTALKITKLNTIK